MFHYSVHQTIKIMQNYFLIALNGPTQKSLATKIFVDYSKTMIHKDFLGADLKVQFCIRDELLKQARFSARYVKLWTAK